MKKPNKLRRHVLRLGGLLGASLAARLVHAHHTESHFEDSSPHKLVYQCNSADKDYLDHILFSCGEMLRKYGDNIHIVVVGIGPGIHILAKKPERPVSNEVRERVASLLQYGVEFHACGNTMKALGWTEKDVLESAKVVEVGADDLMELHQQGYAYISW